MHIFITTLQIDHPGTKETFRFWVENAVVGRPTKDDAASASIDQRLFPRECREAVSSAASPLALEISNPAR